MKSTTRAVVLALSVGLTTTGLTGTVLTGTAWAAYDASALCAAAKPTRSQLTKTLATVRSNTAKAAAAANGLDMQQTGQVAQGGYRYDGTQVRARIDLTVLGSPDQNLHFVGAGDTEYEGHLSSDEPDVRQTLAALGRAEVWTKTTGLKPVTEKVLIDSALKDFSSLAYFEGTALDTSLRHSFRCSVNSAGALVLSDAFSASGLSGTQVETLTFTDSGALATARLTVKGAPGVIAADTFTYSALRVDLPGPVVSKKTWRPAYVKVSFTNLKNATLKSARAKAKSQTTVAKRVAAVRKVAKAKAAAYFPATASTANVTNGVKVRTKKPYSSAYWYFTLTVKGSKVSVKTNLP